MGETFHSAPSHAGDNDDVLQLYLARRRLEQVLIFHIIWSERLQDEDKDVSHCNLAAHSRWRIICTSVSRNDCKALRSAGRGVRRAAKRFANEKEIYLFVRLHVLCFESFVFLPR